ncbi:hypothetical protein PPTG_12985 [Phytophthora nicotianae INRA-310]|uniref:Uncharacterized protein n=1 Tax=Phytophthora nicotianae (strain INRA-310) TaxID=761204 RepID=W2Q3A5_PHYN3|nr:hypothetical protein PPTG_12985 [Phytophthora nicotianae INRA-310]ETN07642.1 hypothetical protein PPTG_12985 [Phytophthora nicotianae INRA-310]
MPSSSLSAHGQASSARSTSSSQEVLDQHTRAAPASEAVTSLSVAQYHREHRRRHGTRSMSRRSDESQAQEPRAPRRGNDLLFDELEEAACLRSYVSAPRSPPMRELRAPNPFPERSNTLRSLRDAPPLPSRYDEGDQRDPNVIRNDLDEAQSCILSTQQSSRPMARPLAHASRRDYGFQPRDAAETARRAAQQTLDTYVCGPAAATADEQVPRHTHRERYLTPQVTTPQEDRERL